MDLMTLGVVAAHVAELAALGLLLTRKPVQSVAPVQNEEAQALARALVRSALERQRGESKIASYLAAKEARRSRPS